MEQRKDVSSNPGLYLPTRCPEHLLPSHHSQNCLQTLSDAPQGVKLLRVENHWSMWSWNDTTKPIPRHAHYSSKNPQWDAGVLDSSLGSITEFLYVLSYLVCKMKGYLRYLRAHLPLSILTEFIWDFEYILDEFIVNPVSSVFHWYLLAEMFHIFPRNGFFVWGTGHYPFCLESVLEATLESLEPYSSKLTVGDSKALSTSLFSLSFFFF